MPGENPPLIESNNLSSEFLIDLDDKSNQVKMDFDYLDQKQGVVIQVIHTGNSSNDLDLFGDIKGVKSIKRLFALPAWLIRISSLGEKIRLSRKLFINLYLYFFSPFLIILGISVCWERYLMYRIQPKQIFC